MRRYSGDDVPNLSDRDRMAAACQNAKDTVLRRGEVNVERNDDLLTWARSLANVVSIPHADMHVSRSYAFELGQRDVTY